MAGRKFESEAASMFEDEDFDKAYRGNVASTPDVSDDVDDEDGADDVAESPDDDEAAWAEAEAKEPTVTAEETETEDFDEDAEDDNEEDEENEDDEEAEVSAARDILAKRSSTVAKKREGKTKAEMIRDEIERRKKSGDSLRACDIIAALNEEGVEVNASQVSVTLRSMGVESTRGQRKTKETAEKPTRGRKPKAAAEGMSRVHHRKTDEKPVSVKAQASDTAFTEADLDATAEFISAVGSAERGSTLLRIFSRMNG